jgi:hypothetical protein
VVADVVVRRCVLTIRGRGGWGWGSDGSRYLAAAVPSIEQALTRVLGDCAIDPDVDVRIAEPMSLAWRSDRTLSDDVREKLVDTVRRAAEDAGAVASAPVGDAQPATHDEQPAVSAVVPRPVPEADTGAELARLLAEWSQSGRLRLIVGAWPQETVTRWVESVRRAAQRSGGTELAGSACRSIADLVLADEQGPTAEGRDEDLLLVLVGALTAAAGGRRIGRATFERAEVLAGAEAPARDGRAETSPDLLVEGGASSTEAEPPEGDVHVYRTLPSDLARRVVVPGLPFLVVVQLSRIGYLDALMAVAEAAQVPAAAQLVATGLAGKVLPPPDRGWRRQHAEADAVAAAAGIPRGDVDPVVHALRADAEPLVPPLTSALAALYAAGRSAADDVLATATPHGVMCGEAAGALPIAWLPDMEALDALVDQLGRPPVVEDDLFAPLVQQLAARSAFPHCDLPDLERHVGAAAGTALGSLAQELWGADVANAPLLALERFSDLEVELRLDDVLAVAIPRGQRWLDLGRAGLLDRWAVPWSPGGHWELVSW